MKREAPKTRKNGAAGTQSKMTEAAADPKRVYHIIDNLSVFEARAVLRTLAENDANLAQRIAEMTLTSLSDVDVEEVAAALYDELDALEVEEVWDRAGRTRHGYVETSEVASQMIEAVLAPYLEELSRYQALGLNLEAGELCKGLLLGLYQFEHESKSQFKDWATDLPFDFAQEVLAAWRRGATGEANTGEISGFIQEELPSWSVSLK